MLPSSFTSMLNFNNDVCPTARVTIPFISLSTSNLMSSVTFTSASKLNLFAHMLSPSVTSTSNLIFSATRCTSTSNLISSGIRCYLLLHQPATLFFSKHSLSPSVTTNQQLGILMHAGASTSNLILSITHCLQT